jgi:citrate synthase
LLADAEAAGAPSAVGARLRSGDLVPGFGHKVYTAPDPRGAALLTLVEEGWTGDRKLEVAHDLLAVMAGREGPYPNVDFALGTLAWAAGMDDGAGEAIFAVARVAGWVAHAVEEYGHALRYRPRAVYVGPPPALPG